MNGRERERERERLDYFLTAAKIHKATASPINNGGIIAPLRFLAALVEPNIVRTNM